MINARIETLIEKPSFRKSLQTKRCLVPADVFFEWAKVEKEKYPVRFILRNEAMFAPSLAYGMNRRPLLQNDEALKNYIEEFLRLPAFQEGR